MSHRFTDLGEIAVPRPMILYRCGWQLKILNSLIGGFWHLKFTYLSQVMKFTLFQHLLTFNISLNRNQKVLFWSLFCDFQLHELCRKQSFSHGICSRLVYTWQESVEIGPFTFKSTVGNKRTTFESQVYWSRWNCCAAASDFV